MSKSKDNLIYALVKPFLGRNQLMKSTDNFDSSDKMSNVSLLIT